MDQNHMDLALKNFGLLLNWQDILKEKPFTPEYLAD